MKKIALYFAGLLLAASCIYPFDPETPPVDRCLVFEGDLVIGESSSMTVRLLQPLPSSSTTYVLDDTRDYTIFGYAHVECSDGTIINGVPRERVSEITFSFNLKEASADKSYRVVFTDANTGKVYRSNWMQVEKAPLIERIDFVPDDRNVKVRLTLTGPTEDTRYFCWTYKEDWEFHSDFLPLYLYRYGVDPYNMRNQAYEEIQGEYDKYYCWNTASSKEVFVADTRDLNKRTLPARQIAEFERTSLRCQLLYCISVTAYGISADRYAYIHHMNEVSNIQGDLFSPNPSAMRGNLRCEQDSTELVLGYVGICQTAMTRAFFEGSRYYTGRVDRTVLFYPDLAEPAEAESNEKGYDYFYSRGDRPLYLVANDDGDEQMIWAPRRCVDCTMTGTKDKPSYWPNSHK